MIAVLETVSRRLALVHYDRAPVKAANLKTRWRRLFGPYIPENYRSVYRQGDFIVLERTAPAGA